MSSVSIADLLRHVCPRCGFAKQPQYARCDACERDMVVEAKRTTDPTTASNAVMDEWEEA